MQSGFTSTGKGDKIRIRIVFKVIFKLIYHLILRNILIPLKRKPGGSSALTVDAIQRADFVGYQVNSQGDTPVFAKVPVRKGVYTYP